MAQGPATALETPRSTRQRHQGYNRRRGDAIQPDTYLRRDENEARHANVLTHDEAWRIAANIAKLLTMRVASVREMGPRCCAFPEFS